MLCPPRKRNDYVTTLLFDRYCEFCWTIFGLLDAIGVPYTRVNIDAFEYAKDNLGNTYRAALVDQTSVATFPQMFVRGAFIGGAADACIMCRFFSIWSCPPQPFPAPGGVGDGRVTGFRFGFGGSTVRGAGMQVVRSTQRMVAAFSASLSPSPSLPPSLLPSLPLSSLSLPPPLPHFLTGG